MGQVMKKVIVKQTGPNEIPTEVMANAIVAISEGIKKLRSGRLNDKALYLLIQHAAPTGQNYGKISQREIKSVLEGIDALSATYLKKRPTA
ncbi:hypothetical protein [Tardiphaga sp. 839_C3_N1_4]|uniref:hypothetical protein n=1 Tax=Tardiphaga sp. 839_C3_N1_4 TaxID=3240761 RepID=UPI003F2353A4